MSSVPESNSRPGKKPQNMSWESFAEERIQAAYAEGDFAALPGFGKPIPGIDEPLDELWWVRKKLEREEIGVPIAGNDIRTDIDRTLRIVSTSSDTTWIRQQLSRLNERIRASNRRLVGHAHGTVMELDVEAIVAEIGSENSRR